jgi:nucleoid DNA-binding protein
MSDQELLSGISERAGVSRQTVQEILEVLGRVWKEEILSSGELELENMGSFLLDHRPGRRGVDTEARKLLAIPPADVVVFTPSLELLDWSNRLL